MHDKSLKTELDIHLSKLDARLRKACGSGLRSGDRIVILEGSTGYAVLRCYDLFAHDASDFHWKLVHLHHSQYAQHRTIGASQSLCLAIQTLGPNHLQEWRSFLQSKWAYPIEPSVDVLRQEGLVRFGELLDDITAVWKRYRLA